MDQGVLAFSRAYGHFLRVLGIIAGLSCLLTMFLVAINVFGRYLFNSPFNGAFVYTQSLLTVMIFFSIALTQHYRGHIKVVFVTRIMSPRWRRFTQTLMSALATILFVLASYATFLFAWESFEVREEVFDAVTYPIYPVKFVVFIGLVILAIQFALDTVMDALDIEDNGSKGDH